MARIGTATILSPRVVDYCGEPCACRGKDSDCSACLGTGFEDAHCPNCGVDLPADMATDGLFNCSSCDIDWKVVTS